VSVYASCKLPDGVTYVILLGLDDDENNPLTSVPAFRDFQENLKTWIAEPPGRRGVDARRVVPALLTAPYRHLRRSLALIPVPLTAHGTGMRASHRPRMNPPGSLRRGVARVVGACGIDENETHANRIDVISGDPLPGDQPTAGTDITCPPTGRSAVRPQAKSPIVP